MADQNRRPNDPTTPSQVGGGINPSATTAGTEGPSTNLGNRDNPTANRPGTEGGGDLRFRCADAGYDSCPWETTGRSEDEIRSRVGEHGREKHGFREWTNDAWDRVRGAIKRAA